MPVRSVRSERCAADGEQNGAKKSSHAGHHALSRPRAERGAYSARSSPGVLHDALLRRKPGIASTSRSFGSPLGHLGHMRTVPCPSRSRATNPSAPRALNTIVGQVGQLGHPRLGQTGRVRKPAAVSRRHRGRYVRGSWSEFGPAILTVSVVQPFPIAIGSHLDGLEPE
jgi:hypothetical protein